MIECSNYKLREKEMEKEKFQFESKEQVKQFYKDNEEIIVLCENDFIEYVDNRSYIRKSELEVLVDEAEKLIGMIESFWCNNNEPYELGEYQLEIFQNTIQALKKDHPEFKK